MWLALVVQDVSLEDHTQPFLLIANNCVEMKAGYELSPGQTLLFPNLDGADVRTWSHIKATQSDLLDLLRRCYSKATEEEAWGGICWMAG